jgi:hypothetical protein
MKKCLCHDKFEYSISEIFESLIGFFVSLMGFIQDAPVDTSEDIEISISRENLERRKE